MTITKAFEWPSPEVLAQNARDLRARYQAEVESFECKFGFTTESLKAKLASGEVEGTSEICDWLMSSAMRGDLPVAG